MRLNSQQWCIIILNSINFFKGYLKICYLFEDILLILDCEFSLIDFKTKQYKDEIRLIFVTLKLNKFYQTTFF